MPRPIHKLTVRRIEALSQIGWHGDGGGLYLRIREDGAKRWIFVWKRDGRRREMFLGTPDDFTLKEVRDMAAAASHLLQQGFDPLEMRKAAERSMAELKPQIAPAPTKSQSPTFGKFADRYIDTHEDGWKNAKHRWQWRNSITNHCKAIVSKPVDAITTDDVLDALKPIWRKIPDTAGRVRTRIVTCAPDCYHSEVESGSFMMVG